MLSLDIHQYDGKIDPNVYNYIQKVGEIKNKNEIAHQFIREIIQLTQRHPNHKIIKEGANQFLINEYDPRNKIDVHTVFCIAWALCKRKTEEELFYLQLIDMITTNGCCVQGRTGRCLQIIFALMQNDD